MERQSCFRKNRQDALLLYFTLKQWGSWRNLHYPGREEAVLGTTCWKYCCCTQDYYDKEVVL